MNPIVQPATVTDMRRDPKSLLERVKREKVVPILVHSEFGVAMIDVEELNRLHDIIKQLKHELFVQETLVTMEDYKKKGGIGPFDSVEAFMESLESD